MRDLQYKVYMSDSLFLYYGQGKAHSERFIETLERSRNTKKEDKSFDEIVTDVIEKTGIIMIQGEHNDSI